jgi:hypothetical protein
MKQPSLPGMGEPPRRMREPDPLGKAALFSQSTPHGGSLGTLTIECSACKRESPVRFRELPRLAMPFTFTLPRRYHTLLKCPGCGRRTWVRAHWRL